MKCLTAIDREVASIKLASLGLGIDTLSADQQQYMCSWDVGT